VQVCLQEVDQRDGIFLADGKEQAWAKQNLSATLTPS
jgi:hypothetical protein